jgi:hypothetical protein
MNLRFSLSQVVRSTQGVSGKSISAIIDKDNDSHIGILQIVSNGGLVGEGLISIDDLSPLRLRLKVEVRDKKNVL